MIKGGYILQPRSIDGSETANMPPVTRELWLYLLRKVNHKDNGQFQRGSNFFALSDIQEDLCWYAGYRKMVYSKPQLTKSLRRLNESNMTATTKATRGVVVTVCNYDYYQDPANYGGNDGGSTKEPRKKSTGCTINNNVEEVKNVKNGNKEPKIKTPCAFGNARRAEMFQEFWDAFEYKKGKGGAEQSWKKLKLTETIFQTILTGAKREAKNRATLIAKGGTAKMAQGWLTEKRWEDEHEESTVQPVKSQRKPDASDVMMEKLRRLQNGQGNAEDGDHNGSNEDVVLEVEFRPGT